MPLRVSERLLESSRLDIPRRGATRNVFGDVEGVVWPCYA